MTEDQLRKLMLESAMAGRERVFRRDGQSSWSDARAKVNNEKVATRRKRLLKVLGEHDGLTQRQMRALLPDVPGETLYNDLKHLTLTKKARKTLTGVGSEYAYSAAGKGA